MTAPYPRRPSDTEVVSDGAVRPDPPAAPAKPSRTYVVRRTVSEFSNDHCTDLAATLTFYSVLSLFPALIALVSLVGLVGNGPQTVHTLVGILRDVGAGSVADTLTGPLLRMSQASGVGLGFVIGILAALWSASGYVGAFSRAMNRIYEVEEGRPVWKLRPLNLVVTLVTIVASAAVAIALVVTGPVASSVGDAIGLGATAVRVWAFAKWPVLLFVVVLIVALLYYATPNVKQPKFRWLSKGSFVAVAVWILASLGFGFYIASFSRFDKTYGSLAGIVIFLLWLWITNLALLFGGELDAELERSRELRAGIAAEEELKLPLRDDRLLVKREARRNKQIERGRALRLSRGGAPDAKEEAEEEAPVGAAAGP